MGFFSELAAFPSIATKIAVWYWTDGANVNLNTLGDGTFYGYSIMTSKINGKIRGLSDRTLKLEKAMEALECGELLKGQGEKCSINGQDASCKPLCVTGLNGRSYCSCNGKTADGQCNGPVNIKCCSETCNNVMDLTFVLDSSGSIDNSDFQKSLNFVEQIIGKILIGENESRVSVINFSDKIEVVTYLDTFFDKIKLLDAISGIRQIGSSTHTGEALEECLNVYSYEKGMRNTSEGVSRVILVLTDGASNGNVMPGIVADQLKSMGISIISIGVGSNLNYKELKEIECR